ncbi:MAG: RimK family alpha-L-glutamate ligase [Clostridia bacterium]|nr:RimK family alpha-L-glutamate ligase [Clostridia bacterium]
MKGLILINGYPAAPKFLAQAERIKEELCALGVSVRVVKNGEVGVKMLSNGRLQTFGVQKDETFCVYLDKDKYLSRALEMSGLRLFNSATAVETCDDKSTTYLALASKGVRVVETIFAPLCYTRGAEPNETFLAKVQSEVSLPVVVKKCYGSFGAGVRLARSAKELFEAAKDALFEPHCYQKYVAKSKGKDVRVIVIGGKAVGAMERTAKEEEFRSNVELGGTGKAIPLTPAFQQAAEKAANVLGLDYCGVDLLYGESGEPLLCEVNSNAFFEAFERVTGINVAKTYAEHIVSTQKR